MPGTEIHSGRCHCGRVSFEVKLDNGLNELSRCDCSLCRRRSAIVSPVPLENFRLTGGEEYLTLYQFNTNTAKHYFCRCCGIYTHHQRRSHPDQYSFNVGCLDGINPYELGDVILHDGVNHPSDR